MTFYVLMQFLCQIHDPDINPEIHEGIARGERHKDWFFVDDVIEEDTKKSLQRYMKVMVIGEACMTQLIFPNKLWPEIYVVLYIK